MTVESVTTSGDTVTGSRHVRSTVLKLRSLDRLLVWLAVINGVLILIAVLGPIIASADPNVPKLLRRLAPPSWLGGRGGIMGADQLGRPLWLRIIYGMRTSYVIGAGSVALGGLLGITLGTFAGYRGGRWDALIMRIVDIQMALPALLFALIAVTVLEGTVSTIIIVLGLSSWMLYARVARSCAVQLRSTELVSAHIALGCSDWRIVLRHIIPNSATPLLAITSIRFAEMMLAEASLSFLGLGIQSPTVSLGSVLSNGREYLAKQWWISAFAGLALASMVVAANMLGTVLQQRWARVGDRDWTLR